MRVKYSGPAWNNGTPLTITAFILSLPSLVFVFLHILFGSAELPSFLDFVVSWTLVLTGMFSGFTTLTACVIAVVASFLKDVSGKAKIAVWAMVSLSLLAFVYVTRISP
jgi:hypothetical protein